jgi:hypothetical protein
VGESDGRTSQSIGGGLAGVGAREKGLAVAEHELPKMEWRDGAVKIALWQQEKTTEDGRQYTESSFTITKSFKSEKTESGYDQRSLTLFPDDVVRLLAMLPDAYRFGCVRCGVPKPRGAQR